MVLKIRVLSIFPSSLHASCPLTVPFPFFPWGRLFLLLPRYEIFLLFLNALWGRQLFAKQLLGVPPGNCRIVVVWLSLLAAPPLSFSPISPLYDFPFGVFHFPWLILHPPPGEKVPIEDDLIGYLFYLPQDLLPPFLSPTRRSFLLQGSPFTVSFFACFRIKRCNVSALSVIARHIIHSFF